MLTPIGSQMKDKNLFTKLRSPKHSFIASFLLQDKLLGDKAEFKEYLDILPSDLSNFPIFFNDDEKAMLEGSAFLTNIQKKLTDIDGDYSMITKKVPEFEKFTKEEFKRALIYVSSRVFTMEINGTKTVGLVPYADMLNHATDKTTKYFYNDTLEGFVMKATKDIAQGDAVYDSYGNKDNKRFFLHYGFVLENNPDNEVELTI